MNLKKHRTLIIITSLIILLPILAGIYLWPELPEQIPTHFNANNQPDGYSSKSFTVFGLPLLLLFVHGLCLAATVSDPKRQNIHDKMINIVLWISPIISVVMMTVTYTFALGHTVDVGSICLLLIAFMFLIIGNYLPKSKQSYTMGFKLPWTLEDENNWNRTHRVAGFLWMLCGIALIICIFFKADWIVAPIMLLAVLVPIVYSYVYYRKHTNKED